MATLKETILEKISGSASAVSESVVNTLVNTEVERRSTIVIAGLKKSDELTAQKKKLDVPDSITYDVDKKEQKGYTGKRIAELKKLDETITNINKAIETCLTDNDDKAYEKLAGLCKPQGNPEKGSGEGEAKSA